MSIPISSLKFIHRELIYLPSTTVYIRSQKNSIWLTDMQIRPKIEKTILSVAALVSQCSSNQSWILVRVDTQKVKNLEIKFCWKIYFSFWAAILAQLAGQLLRIPVVVGSNQVIGNIITTIKFIDNCWKYENKEKRGL